MKKSVIAAIAFAAALPLQAQVSDAAPPTLPPRDPAEQYFRGAMPGVPAIPTRSSRQPEEPPKFSISFPGGTPAELITHLQGQQPSRSTMPNIIVAPPMREVMLPPIELQNVTLEDVFQVLNTISAGSVGGVWQLTGNRDPIWVLNPTPQPRPALRHDILGQGQAVPMPKRTARVLNVGQYLAEFSIDDITTAIQTAWGMLGEGEAEIKFHKDTNLLIAVGQTEQLDVITQVLSALHQEMQSKQAAKQRASDLQRAREERLQSAGQKPESDSKRQAGEAPKSPAK